MSRHAISTGAWLFCFVFAAGFYAGTWFGMVTSPAAYDAKIVELRLRTVFCEQAILNKLMTRCEVN